MRTPGAFLPRVSPRKAGNTVVGEHGQLCSRPGSCRGCGRVVGTAFHLGQLFKGPDLQQRPTLRRGGRGRQHGDVAQPSGCPFPNPLLSPAFRPAPVVLGSAYTYVFGKCFSFIEVNLVSPDCTHSVYMIWRVGPSTRTCGTVTTIRVISRRTYLHPNISCALFSVFIFVVKTLSLRSSLLGFKCTINICRRQEGGRCSLTLMALNQSVPRL